MPFIANILCNLINYACIIPVWLTCILSILGLSHVYPSYCLLYTFQCIGQDLRLYFLIQSNTLSDVHILEQDPHVYISYCLHFLNISLRTSHTRPSSALMHVIGVPFSYSFLILPLPPPSSLFSLLPPFPSSQPSNHQINWMRRPQFLKKRRRRKL